MRTFLFALLPSACLLACSQDPGTPGGTSSQPSRSVEQAADDAPDVLNTSKIDTVILRRFPLLPGGGEATVTFSVAGIDWASPVQWKLIVSASERVLYERSGTSERFDRMFSDPELMPECTEPVECKRNWFLNEWTNLIRFYNLESTGENREVFDSIMPGQVQESLSEYGYSEEESRAFAQEFMAFYAGKEIPMIEFMFDPVSDSSWSLAYHPAIQRLVVAFTP